jgi:retron-type reverse transcriptase
MDLEKFFDKVNHDILIDRISWKVYDQRVLNLIRKYLKSGIMINGIITSNSEDTPQGGPLSPLLSNIMLDEVDKELENRGHKFCRFAVDLVSRRKFLGFTFYFTKGAAQIRIHESSYDKFKSKVKYITNRNK